jgi:hypothetical protein
MLGGSLKNNLLLQGPQLLAGSKATWIVIVVLGLCLSARPALAEFEIQEAGIEKGEVELEYRGAYHGGLPNPSGPHGDVLETEEGEEAGEDEVPLRQSHDFEFQMGITERWMISTTFGTAVPDGESWKAQFVELETQFELVERRGNGLGLAFLVGYGWATQPETANELEFGPIIELGAGKFLLTTNTFFSDQRGEFAETEGLGFEYGWRAEYDFAKRWGIGVEMFGEIEDLANAGSFNDQEHSIGPTLFWKPAGGEEDEEVGDVGEPGEGNREDEGGASKPSPAELSMNIGVQFGLTDVSSDTALKFQGSLAF